MVRLPAAYQFVCLLPVCLSVYLIIYICMCLSVYLYLSVYLPSASLYLSVFVCVIDGFPFKCTVIMNLKGISFY